MKQAAAYSTSKLEGGKTPLKAGNVGLQLLDTTWRMAVPVLILASLGIIADKRFGTKPWVTLAGVVVGFLLAGLLVKRQLDAVDRQEQK